MKLNVALFFLASALEHVVEHQNNFLAKDHVVVHTTTTDVPPVSTTMKCVINLTIQYFLIFTAVAIVRTYRELQPAQTAEEKKADKLTPALKNSCETMQYAPMLCVLFVGTRMRALQLSGGDPDAHDLPQPFVKMAMQACAWSVLVQTIMVLVIPLAGLGEVQIKSKEEGGDGTPVFIMGDGAAGKLCSAVRYLAMAAMYGGFTAVCVGGITMEAPTSVYPSGAPPVSPAVACTMNLCFQYFAVYLSIAIIKTYRDFGGEMSAFLKNIDGTLEFCKQTVVFAPMLCILFIGARMRALQMDPVNGNPQKWAQNCFYLCAYAVLGQMVLLFLIPFVVNGTLEKGESEGDVSFKVKDGEEKSMVFKSLMAIRYVIMLGMYGGFTAVIYSVIVIEHPNGPELTPAISPTMQCVMNLTTQFFFVYLVLWLLITYKQFAAESAGVTSAIKTFGSACKTVAFCPMLSVLFIGMRLRALQITSQAGAPQGWAQQAMFLSTWAVLVQLIMILAFGAFQGAPDTDADGNIESKNDGSLMSYVTLGIRYAALVCMYGGVCTVVYALFTITPETANGSGLLIPGVNVPAPGM